MKDPKYAMILAIQELTAAKNLDKISVDDIVSHAGFSRQTFYRHFTDKYALVFSVYESDATRAISQLPSNWSFEDSAKVALDCFACKPEFYRRAFKNSQIPNSFHSQFKDFTYEFVVEAFGRRKLTETQRVIIKYWISNTVSVIEKWILDGMSRSEDEVIDLCIRLMPEEVKQLYFG